MKKTPHTKEWRKCQWGDLVTLEYGKSLNGYAEGIGKFPVYGTNGKIGITQKPLCSHPGIIIGRKGAYRGVHYSKTPFFVIDTAFYLEPKFEINLLWAYYELLTQDINGLDSGSAIPSTTREAFYSLEVNLPPLPTQHTIARILGSLDDKIELNRQMNETLEAMARTIFQSWFVDFDPVRAKAEGRDTGLLPEIAALFPDGFELVEGREVPRGWGVALLPEMFEIHPKRLLAKDQIAPYLDMQNVPTRGHRPIDWIMRAFGSGTKFVNGDTLLARITPCLENGKTIFVDFLNDGQVGWGSTEYIVLRPKLPLPPEFGYLLARDEDFRAHAILNMSGSSGRQRVPSECFDSFQIVIPSKPVAEKFGELVKPLMARIKENDEQSRTLAQIRDALLPKLMSGEIRVGNVLMPEVM